MHPAHNLPIKGFIETSFVDWPGKLCAVIFFSRCNFRCRYCHNADLVLKPEGLEDIEFAAIMKRLHDLQRWIDGVCVSGGEPTLHACLPDVLRALKKQGLLIKLDTNGSAPEVVRQLIEEGLVDYIAMDVKSRLNEESYRTVTQAPQVFEAVKQTIALLREGRVAYEFRFTVVPAFHQPEDIYQVAMQLNGTARLRIQNFNPRETLDPELKALNPYPEEEIAQIQKRVDQLLSL